MFLALDKSADLYARSKRPHKGDVFEHVFTRQFCTSWGQRIIHAAFIEVQKLNLQTSLIYYKLRLHRLSGTLIKCLAARLLQASHLIACEYL